MPVAGNTIRTAWLYLDINGAGLTGMVNVTDVTLTLRVDTGSGGGAAAEAVTWTEKGSGFYDIAFTPTGQGVYTLFLKELNVGGMQRQWSWTFEVSPSGATFTPAYANAFCSESDIETWIGLDLTATSKPTATQAAKFAQQRAATIMALCAKWGYPVTPLTVVQGSNLQDMLRAANEIGAALDCVLVQELSLAPNVTDRPGLFQAMWVSYIGGRTGEFATEVVGLLQQLIQGTLASLGTDHILSGDTIAAEPTYPTDIGIQVSMGDVY